MDVTLCWIYPLESHIHRLAEGARGGCSREARRADIAAGGYSVAGRADMRFAGSMGIERFGAEDERRADACFEIFRACRAADDPAGPPMDRRVFAGWLKAGSVGDPRETWLLEDDGGIEGWYLLELPSRDNPHLGILDIAVRPDRRRRGFGTALLRHAGARAIANGRDVLTGNAFTGTAGEAFARAAGAAGGQTE